MSNSTIRLVIDAKGTITGLQPMTAGLGAVEGAANKAKKAVDKAVKIDFTASIPGIKNFSSTLDGIGKAAGTVQTALTGGVIGAALVRGLSAITDKAVEFENSIRGVSTVARSFGVSVDDVTKAVRAYTADGLVSATEASLAFKQVLSTGTDLPTAIKLLNGLKDAAAFNRQSFYSLGEAVVATTEGIKNGNSVRADAVGITKNLSKLDEEYAASLGRTVGSLTDVEKTQARVNGFIREAGIFAGDASKITDTYSGSLSKLTTNFDRFLASLGSFITQSTIARGLINGLSSGFALFNRILTKDSPEQKLVKLKTRLRELQEQIESESGVYKKYAQDNADATRKQISALEDVAYYEKLTASIATDASKEKVAAANANTAAVKASADAAKVRAKELKKLDTKIAPGGNSELQQLEIFYKKSTALVKGDVARKTQLDAYYFEKKKDLQDKDFKNQQSLAKKVQALNKEVQSGYQRGNDNPLGRVQTPARVKAAGKEDEFKRNTDIGRGVGAASNILDGKAGATALVSSIGAGVADSFLPGIGAVVGPLLSKLAQGPEAVRAQVKEFAKALPEVIDAIIEAIPVLIEEIANQTPKIIQRLVEQAPKLIAAQIKELPKVFIALASQMPKLAITFIGALIKNVPRIVTSLAAGAFEAIKNVLSKLTGGLVGGKGGIGGTIKSAVNSVTKIVGIKFAQGGEIPRLATGGGFGAGLNLADQINSVRGYSGGTPFKDSINAKVMSGEITVDRSTTSKLKKFLSGSRLASPDGGAMSEILKQFTKLNDTPQVIHSDIKLDNATFAKAILTLARTKQRTS